MQPCTCRQEHRNGKQIVLTGGPGAGKTAVLEIVRQSFCRHVRVLPEAAGIVFRGGFPRETSTIERQAAQRAIFYVQRELELLAQADGAAIVLCDRGTVDGYAYWPSGEDFWTALGTTREEQLRRYDMVIHLRSPSVAQGYNRANPLRVESAVEAAAVDERIARAWDGHPRRIFVGSTDDFFAKVHRAIALFRDEVPECCRQHPTFDVGARSAN